MSPASCKALGQFSGYHMADRGEIPVKVNCLPYINCNMYIYFIFYNLKYVTILFLAQLLNAN